MGARRQLRLVALAAVVTTTATAAAGCGGGSSTTTTTNAAASSCAKSKLTLVKPGQLTIGTDNPAYPPWYAGGTKSSFWKINDPSTGKGFESATAYAVAKQLGFTPAAVHWTYVPFNRSFAPGKKAFDFDINQISYTPERAKVVTFSKSYYDVNQAVVVLKGTKIASVDSIAGLRPFKLGAQVGTTSYTFITSTIKPTKQPAVYPQNAGAVQALKNRQIDGLVVDLPTAFYVSAAQVPNSKVLGQFEGGGGGAGYFGMVFAKGNSLAACVDQALAKLRANGTLQQIQQKWLAKATGAPVLK
ncbi:MAG TPA: ABC transporter substrate-binding protein [Gaiellaceae bacterium]|nr:ABC transporter substrate-binding protein [Gaiellaceae bacterium]